MNTEERMQYLYQAGCDYRDEMKRWRVLALVATVASISMALIMVAKL